MGEPLVAARPEDLPDRAALLAMSGLEFMQAMLAGRIPQAPITRHMNFFLHSVEPGQVAFRGAAEFACTNPMGGVHGGWYGTLLDSALGCAVMTEVPRGAWYTTLEYRVNLVRAVPLGACVEARGRVRHAGRSTAVAEADLTGVDDGRLYATGSTTCMIMRG